MATQGGEGVRSPSSPPPLLFYVFMGSPPLHPKKAAFLSPPPFSSHQSLWWGQRQKQGQFWLRGSGLVIPSSNLNVKGGKNGGV